MPDKLGPPLMFYVAQGEDGACGPGCSEWIAAEGKFDKQSPARLRKFLKTLDHDRLPIYFRSGGGFGDAGIALGRVVRKAGLVTSVGQTVPDGCSADEPFAPACVALKTSGKILPSQLTRRTLCNSACVYALLGGTRRIVGMGARLGIHASDLTLRDNAGRAFARQLTGASARIRQNAAISTRKAYVLEMGADPAMVSAAFQISSNDIHFLTRDEMYRFGIDIRTFVESSWMADERTGVITKEVQRAGDDGRFRVTQLRMACAPSGRVRFTIARLLRNGDGPMSAPVQFGDPPVVVGSPQMANVAGDPAQRLEMRNIVVSSAWLGEVSRRSPLELTADEGDAFPMAVSADGLAAAAQTLLARCDLAQRAVTPRHNP